MIEWILGLTVLNTVWLIGSWYAKQYEARALAKLYDQNTKILNDRTEWLVDRIDVMQDALDNIEMAIADSGSNNQSND